MKRTGITIGVLFVSLVALPAIAQKKKAHSTAIPAASTATPTPVGPDGWADLHWGMSTGKVRGLYPKATPSSNEKDAANGWWELDPIDIEGQHYKVSVQVVGQKGLVVVSLTPPEAKLTVSEARRRATALEKALTLKYGPPTARGDQGPSWRFDRLDIDMTVYAFESINSGNIFLSYRDPSTREAPKL